MTPPGPPFVGRDRELAVLRRAIGEAREGRGALLLVTGEPGSGKTRLVEAAAAEADDLAVHWGRAWGRGGAPAFWPGIQLLRSLADEGSTQVSLGPGAAAVAKLVPEAASQLGLAELAESASDLSSHDGSSRDEHFALFDAVAALLRAAAGRRPRLLILDDVHAADRGTLLLLELAARELRDAGVVFVVTYSPPDLSSAAEAAELLGALEQEGELLPLAGLDQAASAAVVEELAGFVPDSSVAEALHGATGGLPLFLDSVVRLLVAEGRLGPDSDVDLSDLPLEEGVREAVRRRLEPLDPGTTDVLTRAAVIGPDFTLPALERVFGQPGSQLLEDLGAAIDAGVLVEDGARPGHYAFPQALLREVLLDALPTAERVELHRRTADALEELYGDAAAGHAEELAYHFTEGAASGAAGKAVDYALRSARRAREVFAFDRAVFWYERALAAHELCHPTDETARSAIRSELEDARARDDDGQDPSGARTALFRREGDYWSVGNPDDPVRLADTKGLGYLAQLIENPHREVHALELATGGAGLTENPGAVLDDQAKRTYRTRIEELERDIEEAESMNDPERVALAREERDALTGELASAVGLGGRERRTGSAGERARSNVTKAIRTAIERIASEDSALGTHLEKAVRTGTFCEYAPQAGDEVTWLRTAV